MNFAELCDEVILLTGRPELRTLVESYVRAATLKAHQKDFFYRDIQEYGIEFPDQEHITSFKPLDLIDRFRKPAYLREWIFDASDIQQGRAGKKYDVIMTDNARDAYGYLKSDVYYLAGDLLQIRSSTPLTHALFGAYVLPDITPGGYSSWVATEYPYAIIHEAARVVFRSIGANERSTLQEDLVNDWYGILTINSIPDEGV